MSENYTSEERSDRDLSPGDLNAFNRRNVGSVWGSSFLVTLMVILVCLSAQEVNATHFRHGTVTWRTVTTDLSGRTIEFKITQAWRRTFFGVNFIGQQVSTGPFFFGDGTSTNIVLRVTSINAAEDWFYGEAIIVKTYATTGIRTAFFDGCCRISTLQNNRDGSYRVETIVHVGSGNSSPVSTISPIVNLQTGMSNATFPISVNDPDGDALTFRLAFSNEMGGGLNPPGLSIDANTGIASFNSVGRQAGQLFSAAVTILDGQSKITLDFIIKITEQSAPPNFDYSVTPPDNYAYQIRPGQAVNFGVRASDSNIGDVVTLMALGLPPGAVMSPPLPLNGNPVQSTFSWIPGPTNLGTSVISFVAQDALGVQSRTSITIRVSLSPVFDVPPSPPNGSTFTIIPGNTLSFTLSASDPDPTDLIRIVSATNLPPGATLNPGLPTAQGNPATTTFSWQPATSDWGEKTVVFTARDSYNEQSAHTINLLVNSQPIFTSTPATEVIAEELYTYTITTTDDDVPFGDELRIIAQSIPAWLTLTDNGDGTATLTGTPQISDQGPHSVSLLVEDIYHHSYDQTGSTQNFSINVIPCNVSTQIASTNVTCEGGSNGTVTVNVTGGKPDYLYSNDNGTTFQTENVFAGLPAGDYVVIVKDGNDCLSESQTVTIGIREDLTPPVVVTKNIVVQLDALGEVSITAAQVDNGSTDDCGIQTMTLDAYNFDCSHVGIANIVTLTVTDKRGNTASGTATVTVEDKTGPTVMVKNIVVQLDASGSATITAEDIDNGSFDECSDVTLAAAATLTCSHVGQEQSVELTVTDESGNTSTGWAKVTVLNPAPILESLQAPVDPQSLGTTISVNTTFVDRNVVSNRIKWGDGIETQGVVAAVPGETDKYTLKGTYTYVAAGVYTVSVEVTDVCGQTASQEFKYVVIYDPSGGFVTGGGWYNSPAGAYVPNPTAIGKASFGFVSKYKKGSNVPDGNTDFQFQAGDLRFKSTSYEWLVIAGHKAMYKGLGELNGLSGYGFMISVVDGSKKAGDAVDRFRIKIWDAAAVVVYDNQMAAADDAEATTALGGGSIVIHDGKSTSSNARMATAITDEKKIAEEYVTKVYPNPFMESITVHFNSLSGMDPRMQLFDMTGRAVYERVHSFNESGVYSIELSDARGAGLYILQINEGKRIEFIRLIRK